MDVEKLQHLFADYGFLLRVPYLHVDTLAPDDRICFICREPYDASKHRWSKGKVIHYPVGLPCGHHYVGIRCLANWIFSGNFNNLCPLDRTIVVSRTRQKGPSNYESYLIGRIMGLKDPLSENEFSSITKTIRRGWSDPPKSCDRSLIVCEVFIDRYGPKKKLPSAPDMEGQDGWSIWLGRHLPLWTRQWIRRAFIQEDTMGTLLFWSGIYALTYVLAKTTVLCCRGIRETHQYFSDFDNLVDEGSLFIVLLHTMIWTTIFKKRPKSISVRQASSCLGLAASLLQWPKIFPNLWVVMDSYIHYDREAALVLAVPTMVLPLYMVLVDCGCVYYKVGRQ